MNDRNRWSGSHNDRGRQDQDYRQAGGWGGSEGPFESQPQQREPWRSRDGGRQQGGWHDQSYGGDDRPGDWRGNEWRGSRDWGDPRDSSRGDWSSEPQGRSYGRGDERDRPRSDSWAERAWGGSSLREGDRGLSGASGYGASFQRDDRYRPGSQSFAADYGMRDGPNYDQRGWSGGSGASTPGYGRGYGPDYGREESRGFLERAGDTIASWFGDEDAERRRQQDYRGENHRGRGPGDYTRSDDRIREDANDRLTDDYRVDARRITVTVDKGEVTLGGTVPDRESKRRAEDLVEHISGVKHVQNNLRIEAQGTSQYTGQSIAGEWNAGGQRSSTMETGIAGAGTPSATAESQQPGKAAGDTSRGTVTGASGTNQMS